MTRQTLELLAAFFIGWVGGRFVLMRVESERLYRRMLRRDPDLARRIARAQDAEDRNRDTGWL